ncbi:uncharacterized protein [Venturia canescens]|uniref:uncharacterized protein isoform X2 n=1 Tax=Venturia canescens TaxID=32260 RepID=UPI001C9BD411|nr:uncharacterized protein LOC122406415 isoform X2 [Venturia canescens]
MMLVLLLCVIMKIAEFSVGRGSPPLPTFPGQQVLPVCCNKRKRRYRKQHNRNTNDRCKCINLKRTVKGATVMEDPQTPGSDCNSNPADPISQELIGSEFVQDNSEYQWFIDYGYRDGGLHVHPSVLSSLSTSYTQDDLGYYDDLARNLDANLAEVDMESFRTADIHTLLTALPVMCTDPVQHSEGEDSACSTTDTISICKSSLLFSPVKETPVLPPGGSYSVDSLDCEDMLLTCQTNNKNNYTIAFEGSMTMYSDGSQDFESQEKQKMYEARDAYYTKLDLKNILDLSMACSDSKIYTTWSNLKHSSSNKVMTRHPSGNNNTIPNFLTGAGNLMLSSQKRSLSLPDLRKTQEFQRINAPLNFSIDSADCNAHATNLQSSGSAMSRSVNEDSSGSVDHAVTGKKLQNLSLVRLFMKQKSMSAEGMSLTLDQSDSVSESGWPTSNSDSGTANTNTQIPRHNINVGGGGGGGGGSNGNSNNSNEIPENDFSINWVKTDCYKSSHETSSSDNTSKRITSIKEFREESPSVEELSESLLKSGISNSKNFSEGTRAEEQLKNRSANNTWCKESQPVSKTTGIQAIIEVEENGVQTSLIYPIPGKPDYPHLRETIVDKKPVYVVYPNYTLPDLSFLNRKDVAGANRGGTAGMENIALKPQVYDRDKTGWKRIVKSGRPFSCNDIDTLRQRGFSHVKDWESLTFLLPSEYKRVLYDVPEVSHHITLGDDLKKPLFCLSPPMRHRTRPISEIIPSNFSSSSSTGTQPSSGYRGSSTILTDSSSNLQVNGNSANPLYLYRYDSMSSAEASLVSQDKKSHRSLASGRPGGNSTFTKRSISLPQGESADVTSCGKVPPRPPLPKSILRKNRAAANKRYSMFEMGGVEEVEDRQSPEPSKRMSLPEPYYINNDLQLLRHGRIVDSEKDVDEVEERRYAERLRETGSFGNSDSDPLESSGDDVKQLEEFLKRSGFSSQSSDGDEDPDLKLRSYVRKFLALRMNKDIGKAADMMESHKKSVSFAVHQRKAYLANKANVLAGLVDTKECPATLDSAVKNAEPKPIDLEEKKKMMWSVNKAVDLLVKYWHTQPIQTSRDYIDKNECAQLCVSNLCPALYAIMSDGLKPQLNSTFGPIANSVWQVVEASSQQGPLTNTLNELVQKINGEDLITEGMLKFHAFVFGLLNLRALDAWFAYLCTRETILRKHYNSNSLFVGALGCANAREVVDAFLNILQPLAFCPFQLDLLYQYRQLHNSFGNINNHALTNNPTPFRVVDSPKEHHFETSETTTTTNVAPSPKRIRPRSCGVYYNEDKRNTKTDSEVKKRWSHLPGGAKMYPGLEKLTSEDSEDYTDSLEHTPLNRPGSSHPRQNTPNRMSSPDVRQQHDDEDSIPRELKFRKLQEKWELMVDKEEPRDTNAPNVSSPNQTPTSASKSKIPRLLTSPIKQPSSSSTPAGKTTKSPVSGIPSLKKPANATATKLGQKKTTDLKAVKDVTRRTSRVDQDPAGPPRILTRPSSLPYKSHGVTARDKSLVSPHRRAASTSLPRPTAPTTSRASAIIKQPVKEVRTLTHRLPSDNGHLSFNEGERLKVILEVDNKWLLCARGDRKGLVPRSCVHPLHS